MPTNREVLYKKGTYDRKVCVVCKKYFYLPKGRSGGKKGLGVRPRYAKTCSRQCSAKYSNQNYRRMFVDDTTGVKNG